MIASSGENSAMLRMALRIMRTGSGSMAKRQQDSCSPDQNYGPMNASGVCSRKDAMKNAADTPTLPADIKLPAIDFRIRGR